MTDESQNATKLANDLLQAQGALTTLQTKYGIATQMLGESTAQVIEARSFNVFLQGQNAGLNNKANADNIKIEKLESELKTLQPEETANQLIDLNNEIAAFKLENDRLREDNARLNRVVAALDRELSVLTGRTPETNTEQDQNSEEQQDANAA